MSDLDDYFNSLHRDIPAEHVGRPAREEPEAPRHPCGECGGSGTWVSPRGRKTGKCRACNGRGHFKQSFAQRMKAKARRIAKAQGDLDARKVEFDRANPGVSATLAQMASWSDFARSLNEGYEKYGSLTPKQLAAANAMIAKTEARKAAKRADHGVDVSRIVTMFDAATSNGLKRPVFRADGLRLSLAPASGRNAGAIYVKDGYDYVGKIADGRFAPAYGAPADIAERLLAVAVDPVEAARKYGRDTGSCSCCGRTLTDPTSIENGIGPVCEAKFGF